MHSAPRFIPARRRLGALLALVAAGACQEPAPGAGIVPGTYGLHEASIVVDPAGFEDLPVTKTFEQRSVTVLDGALVADAGGRVTYVVHYTVTPGYHGAPVQRDSLWADGSTLIGGTRRWGEDTYVYYRVGGAAPSAPEVYPIDGRTLWLATDGLLFRFRR